MFTAFTIAGGVALLLFGVRFLRKGLDRLFGPRLGPWLEGLASTPLRAWFSGVSGAQPQGQVPIGAEEQPEARAVEPASDHPLEPGTGARGIDPRLQRETAGELHVREILYHGVRQSVSEGQPVHAAVRGPPDTEVGRDVPVLRMTRVYDHPVDRNAR